MKLYTIGFTRKSAETFFGRLKKSGARTLVDVRLNNVSQLAGFAKKDDLRFFVQQLCGIDYHHVPALAPTQEMLDAYRKEGEDWDSYAPRFRALMASRRIEEMDRAKLDGACLLCSEDKPHHCHRSLIAQYLQDKWRDVEVVHL